MDEKSLKKIKDYIFLLEKWNNKLNLSSYRDLKELMINHIIDSFSILEVYNLDKAEKIADIGTGPGLPGVLLSIIFPEKIFYLIEPRKKYFMFLNSIKRLLKIDNIILEKRRVEDINGDIKFDIILNRAVTDINNMIKLANKFLNKNGIIFSYKGKSFYKEFPIKYENYYIELIKKIKLLEIFNKSLYIIGLRKYI